MQHLIKVFKVPEEWAFSQQFGYLDPKSAGIWAQIPASCSCSLWEAAVLVQRIGFLPTAMGETWIEFPAPSSGPGPVPTVADV